MNSKTTVLGVLTIIGGMIAFAVHGLTTGNWMDAGALAALAAAATAGLGLIRAADATP